MNINKMEKLVLIILGCLLILSSPVQATGVGSEGESDAGGVYDCGNSSWCWEYNIDNTGYSTGIVNGIRISFYEADGSKYGNSVDFINKSTWDISSEKFYYMSNVKRSKLDYANEYINSGKSYSPVNIESSLQLKNNAFKLDFPNFLTVNGYTSSSIVKDILNIDEYQDLVSKFSKYQGVDGFAIDFDEMAKNRSNYYMIIEPATVIYNSKEKNFIMVLILNFWLYIVLIMAFLE